MNGVPMGSQLFDLGSGVLLGVELCEDLWRLSLPAVLWRCKAPI